MTAGLSIERAPTATGERFSIAPLPAERAAMLAVALRRAALTRVTLPAVTGVAFPAYATWFIRPPQIAESLLVIARRLAALGLGLDAAPGVYRFAVGGPQRVTSGDVGLLTGLPTVGDEPILAIGPGGGLELELTVGPPDPARPSPLTGWTHRVTDDRLELCISTDSRIAPADLLAAAARSLLAARSAPAEVSAVLRALAALPPGESATRAEAVPPAATDPDLACLHTWLPSWRTFVERGLAAALGSAFPLTAADGGIRVDLLGARLAPATRSAQACLDAGESYTRPVLVRLKVSDLRLQRVNQPLAVLGECPAVGERGTLVIDGEERLFVPRLSADGRRLERVGERLEAALREHLRQRGAAARAAISVGSGPAPEPADLAAAWGLSVALLEFARRQSVPVDGGNPIAQAVRLREIWPAERDRGRPSPRGLLAAQTAVAAGRVSEDGVIGAGGATIAERVGGQAALTALCRAVCLLDPDPPPGGPWRDLAAAGAAVVTAPIGGLVESLEPDAVIIAGVRVAVPWTARLLVHIGQQVAAGEPIAELPGVRDGAVALGRRLRVVMQPGDEPHVIGAESLPERFAALLERRLTVPLGEGRLLTRTTSYDAEHLNRHGVVQVGTRVRRGMVLAGLLAGGEDVSLRAGAELAGWQVAGVHQSPVRVVIRLCTVEPLQPDDQLCDGRGWVFGVNELRPAAALPPAGDGAPADLLLRGLSPPPGSRAEFAAGSAYLMRLRGA